MKFAYYLIQQNYRIKTIKMNSLLNYQQNSQDYTKSRIRPQNSSFINSRFKRKRQPQSKLSYLKKLFSNNHSLNRDDANFSLHQSRIKSKQVWTCDQSAFKKSNLIAHTNKLIDQNHSYHYQNCRPYESQLSKNTDHIIQRYKKSYQENSAYKNTSKEQNRLSKQAIKQLNIQKNYSKKQNDLQNTAILLNAKQKLEQTMFQNEKKKKSADFRQNVTKIQRFSDGNLNTQQNQKRSRQKQQLKQLRRIDKMLMNIKIQIIKNRSIIIEGVKKLKNIKFKIFDTKENKPYLMKNNIKNDQKIQILSDGTQKQFLKKSINLLKTKKLTKPVIQYQLPQKLR